MVLPVGAGLRSAGARLGLCVALIGLGVGLGAGVASAAEPVPAEVLAPHRAVYDLSLVQSRGNGGVRAVSGRLVYEFARSGCHSFTLTYRQVMRMESDEGKSGLLDFISITTESDDGKRFSFSTTSSVDGGDPSRTEGEARRRMDGSIVVSLKQPEERTADLPASVLFPTEHMRRVIGEARAGAALVNADVFDGSDTGIAASPTLAVIGPVLQPTDAVPDASAGNQDLRKLPRWPLSLSYFDSGTGDGEQVPKFIFGGELYENGISRALELDYGTFVIRGKLTSLERLPAASCPDKATEQPGQPGKTPAP